MISLKSIKKESLSYILVYDYWDENITNGKIVQCESTINEYGSVYSIPSCFLEEKCSTLASLYADMILEELKNVLTVTKFDKFMLNKDNAVKLRCGKKINL